MSTLLVHITIVEGKEAEFEALARSLYATTHEVETGVRRYEYWRGEQPRHYLTLIATDDFRAFIAHQTSEHHEAASPKLGGVIESLRFEWLDPVAGASDLVSTEMQAPLPDADELTRRYSERFAAHVSDWWLPLRSSTER